MNGVILPIALQPGVQIPHILFCPVHAPGGVGYNTAVLSSFPFSPTLGLIFRSVYILLHLIFKALFHLDDDLRSRKADIIQRII